MKVNKRRGRRGKGEEQGVQEGVTPWFKRSCAHRERALLGLRRGGGEGAGGSLEGCVHICVYLCFFVCTMQSQVCHIQYSCQPGLRIPKQPVWEYTDAPASSHLPPPAPFLLLLLCSVFLPSLSSHIWSAVSTAIPLTNLIFVSNGGVSLNKTFVLRDH